MSLDHKLLHPVQELQLNVALLERDDEQDFHTGNEPKTDEFPHP